MKLQKNIEEKIKISAIKHLKDGKPEWDIPHTFSAVKWMKLLIREEGGDERILLPAIYLHDTGYKKLPKNYNFRESIDAKKKSRCKWR